MFLPAPVLAILGWKYVSEGLGSGNGCLVSWLLWLLLGINFVMFVAYAAMSGGGV